MKQLLTILLFFSSQLLYAQIESAQTGDWSASATWVGGVVPQRTDDVIINSNHIVTVKSQSDNGGDTKLFYEIDQIADDSDDDYPGHGQSIFYHEGDITIATNATLRFDTQAAVAGIVIVESNGLLSSDQDDDPTTDDGHDFMNVGYLYVRDGAKMIHGDDFMLSASSETIIDTDAFSSDDLYIIGSNARICGTGSLHLDEVIQTFGDADEAKQICKTFDVDVECKGGTYDGDTYVDTCRDADIIYEDSDGDFLLPIHLLSFRVSAHDQYALISWATASEYHNKSFTIQRSVDGVNFEDIAQIQGVGYSASIRQYEFEDLEPIHGTSFYRLLQIDRDGVVQVVASSSFVFQQFTNLVVGVSPNPIQHKKLECSVLNANTDKVHLTLQSLAGKKVYEKLCQTDHQGNLVKRIDLPLEVKSGLYLLIVADQTERAFVKVLIE